MDAIITLIGFVIGIIIFFAIMQHVTAIVYNCSSVAITFFLCWGIGIVLAWIAWKIAVIVGIVALVMYFWGKLTGGGKKSGSASSQNESTQKEQGGDGKDN